MAKMIINRLIKIHFIVLLAVLLLSASSSSKNSVRMLSSVPQLSKVPKDKIAKVVNFLETRKLTASFYPKSVTGCFCDLTYDPTTRMKFINFHRGKILGKGYFKVVTTAVRYDGFHPEVVARGDQTEATPLEKKMTQYVQGFPHVMKTYGFVDYKKNGQIHYDVYSKYYHDGSLMHVLKKSKQYRLTVSEKITMAQKSIQAVEAMHQHKIIHRDIKLLNFLVDMKRSKKKRDIEIVVSDFGAARFESEVEGSRPHASMAHVAPEGVLRPLSSSEYYAGDIFAFGTSFLWLLDEQKPLWVKKSYFTRSGSSSIRYDQFVQLLNKEVVAKRTKLLIKQRTKGLSREEKFRLILYQMVLPDPAKRGTATSIRKQLDAL